MGQAQTMLTSHRGAALRPRSSGKAGPGLPRRVSTPRGKQSAGSLAGAPNLNGGVARVRPKGAADPGLKQKMRAQGLRTGVGGGGSAAWRKAQTRLPRSRPDPRTKLGRALKKLASQCQHLHTPRRLLGLRNLPRDVGQSLGHSLAQGGAAGWRPGVDKTACLEWGLDARSVVLLAEGAEVFVENPEVHVLAARFWNATARAAAGAQTVTETDGKSLDQERRTCKPRPCQHAAPSRAPRQRGPLRTAFRRRGAGRNALGQSRRSRLGRRPPAS